MIKGRMYCLDEVLKTGEGTESHFLLVADGEAGYEISFGRNRKLHVSSECYFVALTQDKYTLDKITFDGGMCDYLKVLRDRNIVYEIPKSLPASINRMYSRFECAVGDTWWSRSVHGFFGVNGYAITDVGYIGDDRYENYEICFCINPGSFHVGEHIIKMMSGIEVPKDFFIEKLLEEVVHVEEGGALVNLLKEAGVWRHIEQIQFVTDDEEEEVTNEGPFKETVG